ncbi:NAD(P)/FAD-dependent oxidoreductase [Actinomycetospora sp. TBRC 11914]|uniref:NAD(P)/FAD-dependent oxidoreductase n=1 Tax=Actinomycetospora sp. TBRC 11914 TaxID=2729387 RepID=UPI00145E4EED|nr:NAD(P)/FAD-dependent oxidoreductase [Actinomycetospora sp. TBRC 11914]NMO89363.1 FAD-dependent monooxygenase [Actinomycetospora sp. TBRC 11914]
MQDEYDVAIVGGRCAGASLAIRLARAGLRVCVLDRARFPSDVPSTHGIQPAGATILRELGCFDTLAARTDPIVRGTVVVDDARIEFDRGDELLGAPMLNVRRGVLDAVLLDAARAAGAEVRTRTVVTGLRHERGRVAGVVTPDGPVPARLVVGADGAGSTVARLVGAGEYCRTPAERVFLWGYFEDTDHPPGHVWLGRIGDHGYLASPTDGGAFLAVVAASRRRRAEVLSDRPGAFAEGLRSWPELEAVVAGGRRTGPLHTVPDRDGFFRRSAGPGWVLVGDAGHVKDPTPGQGIADALRQTTALAPAVVAGLADGDDDADLDAGLRRWWTWRDRDAWAMYWFARDLGAAGPVPLLTREVMRRVAADPRRCRTLLRVLNHDVPPGDLLTAPLALGALGGALLHRPGERRRLLREARAAVVDEVRHLRPPRAA